MRERILHYLETTEAEQLQLLERLILQTSHTLDKDGVDRVGRIIAEALADCSLTLTVNKVAERGDNLIFHSAACCTTGPRHILLVGHMDTVFPRESPFNSFRTDADHAYGPGVIDMKGGLVLAIYLLKALQSQNLLESIPIVFICNSDEEMGSTYSTGLIREEASKSLCALVFECGGGKGEVVTARKGKSGYRLEIFGKAGHAAFTAKNGKASAIVELAHKILAVEKLNNPERQIVVNVGRIAGGTAANVVAAYATADIDIRYLTREDQIVCETNLADIVAQCTTPGTQCSLNLTSSRPPMEQSPKILDLYLLVKKQAKYLSMELAAEQRSGVSDANTIAECGIPVLDGLGPVGDLDHSSDEYMVKATLVQRCKLATLAVIEIWRQNTLPGV
jgi:glutamate carboxypeptidase